MMAITISPSDLQTLRELEPKIAEAEAELSRAERAGFDVTEARKKLQDAKRLRDGIIREYG